VAIEVMQDVWKHATKLRGTETLLMLALADAADPVTRTCWPSVKRLAVMARCNERRVQRLLRDLTARGYVTVETVAGRSNRYTVTTIEAWEGWPSVQGCPVGHPRPVGHPGVASGPPAPDNGGHPNRKEPSKNRQIPRSPVDERVAVVQQHWTTAWQAKTGQPYPGSDYPRMGRWVKRQPKARDATALCGWIDAYLADPDPWVQRNGYSWAGFESRVPAIVAGGGMVGGMTPDEQRRFDEALAGGRRLHA